MFCYTLLYIHSRFAIILIGKRELVALLSLTSWCLRVCSLRLWYFLIILTIFEFIGISPRSCAGDGNMNVALCSRLYFDKFQSIVESRA